jgi:hypothetical protein
MLSRQKIELQLSFVDLSGPADTRRPASGTQKRCARPQETAARQLNQPLIVQSAYITQNAG